MDFVRVGHDLSGAPSSAGRDYPHPVVMLEDRLVLLLAAEGDEAEKFWSLTASQWAAIATAATVGLLLAAVWQVWIAIRGERKRSQPVVVAHEAGNRRWRKGGKSGTALDSFLTNSGGGAAFNVRFGVAFDGVRYPYRLADEEPGSGSRQRVVPVGGRVPEEPGRFFEINVPWEKFAIGRDTDERRVYWCRYQNAYGQMWETLNPWRRYSESRDPPSPLRSPSRKA
jgi:hypothetical protein